MAGVSQAASEFRRQGTALLAGLAAADLGLHAVAGAVPAVPGAWLTALGGVASWAMFLQFGVQVTPHLFPARLVSTTRAYRFRGAVAAAGVGVALAVDARLGGGTTIPVGDRGAMLAGALLFVAGTVAVVAGVRTLEGSLLGPGFAADLLDAATPFERVERAGLRRVVTALAAVAALTAVLGLFMLLGAVLSPLTEVVVVVWGVGRIVGDRAGLGVPAREWFDLKRRLTGLVAVLTAGGKGVACFVVATTGLFVGGVFAASSLTTLATVVGKVLAGTYSAPVEGLFVSVGLFVQTTYTLWYWLRVVDRLPHFLDEWVALSPREAVTRRGWIDPRPQVTRPPGLMVPPMLVAMVTLTGQLRMFDSLAETLPARYYLGMAVAVAVAAASVWRAYRRPPQRPLSDAVALPAALSVQLALSHLVMSQPYDSPSETMIGLVEIPLYGGLPPWWALENLLATLLAFGLLVVLVFYFPDVREQRHRGGGYRLLPPGFVLTVGFGLYLVCEQLPVGGSEGARLRGPLAGFGLALAVLGGVYMVATASLLVPGTSPPGDGEGLGRFLRAGLLFAAANAVLVSGPILVPDGWQFFWVMPVVWLLLLGVGFADLGRRLAADLADAFRS